MSMKAILIIITWMTPHVPVSTLELPVRTEQECLQDKAQIERGFAQVDGLNFIIECVPNTKGENHASDQT